MDSTALQRVHSSVPGDPAHLPERLCAALCEGLEVDAAGMTLLTQTASRQLLGASDERALLVEELQFTCGEGPCMDAARTKGPVRVEDLRSEVTPWPAFGSALREQLPEVTAVFAFPLRYGTAVLGTVDLLRTRPGPLGGEGIEAAGRAADAAVAALLTDADRFLESGSRPRWEPADVAASHWGSTRIAAGVLAQRLDLSPTEALSVMRGRAFRDDITLIEVSADILGGRDR